MAPRRPPRRPPDKAKNLLLRFPVTDLARAVSLTGERRRRFLETFVKGSTTLTYMPTREAATMIYGVQVPLFETPVEPWEAVEKYLRANTDPSVLDMNLKASCLLFNLVRPKGYIATKCDAQVLRVRLKQIVHIGLEYYITQGQKLIFNSLNLGLIA